MDSDYYYSNENIDHINKKGGNKMGNEKQKLFDILKERGYIKDMTHEKEIVDLLNKEGQTFYLGIDPTADSLHVGHFFALTLFRWLQDFGHKGIIVIGGATALIGDPSGKSDMRMMLSKKEVEHNKKEVKELIKKFVKIDGDNPAIILDNADWINEHSFIDFMRNIGVHFNVNTMLKADCYARRLAEGGLTFLEMGYMLMQGYDFVHLNNEYNCRLQIGGSDQWSNIIAGVDLSRKINNLKNKEKEVLYGLCCPLLVKADGEKMGKTESGTLWVSRDKTTVYDFYQTWINCFDEDVERTLTFFTRMPVSDIKELCKSNIIKAKKLMAFEVTKLVHGEKEAEKAKKTAEELFGTKKTSEDMPVVEMDIKLIEGGINILDLLVEANIAPSKSEGRRLIEQGGIKINQEKEKDVDRTIFEKDLKEKTLAIQKGKKTFIQIKF